MRSLCTRFFMPLFGLVLLMFFACLDRATASPGIHDPSDEILVTVVNGNLTLVQLFDVIEKQTPLSFGYDENLVNIHQKIFVPTGRQVLTRLLDHISKQTGLSFNLEKNIVLVFKPNRSMVQTAAPLQLVVPVRGIVTDASGKPMVGATVSVKGTRISVQTDGQGNFSVAAAGDAVLIITFIGYKDQEVAVNGRIELEVQIVESGKAMSEVVVIGYQTQRRADITGAVSVVDVSDVAKLPVGFADQALQGKAAGLRVTQSTGQPGDGVIMRIRGVGTINNNDPLFVIDGVPTKDGINFLSANDIESITVLKDAASTAIYGARSANGVIVVTTKGGKKGKPQISYSGYGGIQEHGTLTKMANTTEYVQLYNEAVVNDNVDITNTTLKRIPIPTGIPMANTDWLSAIFQKAQVQSHEIAISGGNDKTLYYISANYFDQDGIILNSWYKRYSVKTKLNLELTDRINAGVNLNISYSDKSMIGSSGDGYGGNGGSVVRYALFRTPAIPIYNADGSYTDLPQYPQYFGDGYNPVALAENTDNKEKQFRVFGDIFGEYKIAKDLKFKTSLGLDVFITEDKRFDENYGTNLRINSPSVLTESTTTNTNLIWDNTLRYAKSFNGVHNFSFLAGTEAISNDVAVTGGSDRNFPDQIPSLRYFGNGLNILARNVFESEQQWALFSLFANVNYNYDSRYLLSFNVRRDGSSRFGANNRYANFYSGSAGWNIANEKWVQEKLPVFSVLKIRTSFGQLGNQDIGNYPWASIVGRGYNYVFGDQPAVNQGYTISMRGNENVKWESSTQFDAGLDMGFLQNKLTMTLDYFIKTTTNMLIPIPLPLIGGSAATPFVNAGSVENNGIEFEVTYRNNVGKLRYEFSGNFATLNNKVLSLANGAPIPGGRIDNNIFATLTAVGHPIGSFYMYQMEGIFQNDADIFKHAYQGNYIRPGDVKFKDQNGDGVIDDKDRTFLGSAIPKFTYALTSTFQYSNFDLSVFFQGAYGNKLYLQVNQDIEGFYRSFNLTQRVYDERWHGEGTSNTMPRVSWLGSTNNKTPSSRFLEDASYLRLKNIQLGYTFSSKLMQSAHIKGLRIYVSAQNILTFTKYTGLDPEMHTSDNVKNEAYQGDVAAGIDWGTYPSAKSYFLGLNLNF
jgi:TonB-dependent starch-binding outer membrane protein SusC